jgi:shikimate dehydrogenase
MSIGSVPTMSVMDPNARTASRANPFPVVTGKTLLFPVVGSPVSQVKAPTVFNALFARAGVNALVVPLELPAQGVIAACRALLQSPSVGGLLVTVPYKKTLFDLVDQPGDEAQVVGAVNAIRRAPDGSLVGDLFDGQGFVSGLKAAGHDAIGKSILVLGAGGAGAAIAAALAATGVGSLSIFDPNSAQAGTLAQILQRRYPQCIVKAIQMPIAAQCDIVVNATPLGMKPTDPLPIDPALLDAATLVADVIMEPATTRLLQLAAERGLATHPGQPMLDYQVPAYLEFFGLDEAAQLASSLLRERTGLAPA